MRKRLLWLTLLALSNMAYAQPAGTQNPTKLDFNIPTPNTAAFNKYGNIPVNLFSGLPNISVPIYTVNAGKHTLPIALSYHAAGIKVSDLSSDVGLGWNLNAAYTISRVLRGKPDERGYESQQGASLIAKASPFLSVNSTIDTFKAVADGIWDTQPDEFNFNIGSASGKFIIGNDGIITMPDQDVKVSYTKTPVEHDFVFVLTDAQGVRYYFNDYSTTSSESCSDFGGTMDYASTWYVSKIVYPDTKDSLVFNYNTELQVTSTLSETRNYDYGDINPYPVKVTMCPAYTHVFEKKLNRIVFPNGKVDFNYNTVKYDVAGSLALSNIAIYDNSSNLIRKFNLGYNYYNDYFTDSLAKKLRLDSVYTSVGSEIIDKYNFGYDGNSIPPYGSFSQDHWGYNNGYSNGTLIEGKTFTDGMSVTFDVIGGNRDVNPNETGRGVLTRIYHPTGGNTWFQYENNTVGQDCEEVNYLAIPVYGYTKYTAFSNCKNLNPPGYQNETTTFTAPVSQLVTIQVERNTWTCVGNTKTFILKDLTTNQVLAQGMNSVSKYLDSGHVYSLYVEADCRNAEQNMLNCEDRIRATVTFQKVIGYQKNKYVGGLRVKRIIDYDPYSNVSNVRTYDYSLPNEPDRSSGIAQMKPNYESNYRYRFVRTTGPHSGDLVDITSFVFSSLANNTAQNNSSPVAYKYVRETYGANGEGGSVLYNFSTPYHKCEINYPFAPATSYAHRNGQLLRQQTFDKNNVLVRQVDNVYSYELSGSVPGWKTAYLVNKAYIDVKEVYKFRAELYNYLSEKVRLVKTTTTDLTATGSLITTTFQNYLGSSNYYPYQTLTQQPDGAQVEEITYLSSDYNTSALTNPFGAPLAMKYMKENHLTAYPVESFTKVDGKIVSGNITEYVLDDFLGKVRPKRQYKLQVPAPLTTFTPMSLSLTNAGPYLSKDPKYNLELTYRAYNEKGNPAIMYGSGQQSISLIWGHDYNNPIAKVFGDSLYKIGFTSFEPDAAGNWLYNEANTTASDNATGNRCYILSNGDINWNPNALADIPGSEVSGTPVNGGFIVSYWIKNGNALVNGTAPYTTGATASGWTYCEHNIYNPTGVTVTGSGYIDELRLYPMSATMESYTYDLFKGITSGSNAAGHISRFEYDVFGRLVQVKDEQGNIVKRNTYQMQATQ